MEYDKELLKKLIEEELLKDELEIPEIKRSIYPLSYNESIRLCLELGKVLGRDTEILNSNNNKEINEYIISVYDDLSRYDEYYDIATKFLKFKFKLL
jgi:hypothetical protein